MNFLALLREKPVIAALRNPLERSRAEVEQVALVFLLGGTIFELPELVAWAQQKNKCIFVDVDLIKGVGRDAPGIQYLARESKVHGIITTKSNLVQSARKEGLGCIQRIFVLDSESLSGGLNVINRSRPDAVEVLPGVILPKVMPDIKAATDVPVIAGGLIRRPQEVMEILDSGAIGVSSSTAELFSLSILAKRT